MPKHDSSSPSVTRDKQICHSHVIKVMASISPDVERPMEPFESDLYLLSKFDVSSSSMTGDI